jgi:hypothetical protein
MREAKLAKITPVKKKCSVVARRGDMTPRSRATGITANTDADDVS